MKTRKVNQGKLLAGVDLFENPKAINTKKCDRMIIFKSHCLKVKSQSYVIKNIK